jgi:hypothetical protein
LACSVPTCWADNTGIDVVNIFGVLLLETAWRTQDTLVLGVGFEAEPEAALNDCTTLRPGGALESDRAVLWVTAKRAVGAV